MVTNNLTPFEAQRVRDMLTTLRDMLTGLPVVEPSVDEIDELLRKIHPYPVLQAEIEAVRDRIRKES